MKKWRIPVTIYYLVGIDNEVTVEAATREEALRKANEAAPHLPEPKTLPANAHYLSYEEHTLHSDEAAPLHEE